ncbi:hypothetical protein NG798_17450 [Ancylothrix sp. C2]|uniref:hypothetical protein n=1 Tax=Ancylothrix sp. D3o TaxID=2953691 RepID=UPI0021BBB5F8|nr:hypothetical protein [Ancylothrix sp. D3o]MCT7951593.1 hypothetical protein [Ancylothrix sp. D3o]
MSSKKTTNKNSNAEVATTPQTDEENAPKTATKKALSSASKTTGESQSMKTPLKMNQPKLLQTIQSLEKLQLGFISAVSELSEQLTLEASKLAEVQVYVAEEIQQLEALHSVQVADGMLDNLVEEYEESSKTFEEELNERRDALKQEAEEQEKAWEKEQEEHQRMVKEQKELQVKNRQRDNQEYLYELKLQRQLDSDEYELQKKNLYQELEEAKQAKDKEWAEREKSIAEREKAFTEVKEKVENFHKEKEAAIKRGSEEGKGIASYQAKVKADLYAKDIEGQKQVYQLRFQSLEQTIQSQETRIQSLSKQLDAALKQVQDLAVKAIDGASNLSSSQLLREIALEQAKTLQKMK